jgi:3-hydroxyacyl-[acyl-carrier-protein] dehydratase
MIDFVHYFLGAAPGSIFFFAAVDGVKWKKPVIPGDVLVMEVEITKWKAKFGIAKAKGKVFVDGTLACDVGEMTFAIAK